MAKKYNLEILTPARSEMHEIARLHLELVGPASARKITDKLKRSLGNLTTERIIKAVIELAGFAKLVFN